MNKKLKSTLKKYSNQKEDKVVLISGILGIPLNGVRTVEVPNRRGFVFVRLKGNTSELIQAYNSEVSPVYDLPVLVGRQGNIYKVFGRNLDRYQDWGKTPYLPKHGAQHSFNHALNIGGDIVWVYSQQFMPLLSYPSGTQGDMTLSVEPHFYEWEGSWRFAQNTGTPSYTPYLPTITGSARMVLSYIDPSDNSIRLVPGTPFSNTITGSSQLAQYIPDIPRSVGIPLSAVRLVTGTTQIGWDAIYDVRDFYHSWNSSGTSVGVGGGGAGVMAWDEGVPLGTGTVFNFVGSNIDATISGSVVRVFVTGSAGGDVSEWNSFPGTVTWKGSDDPTYNVDATGNVTGTVAVGAKVKLTHYTDKYFIVTSIGTPSGTVTPITLYGGTDWDLAASGTITSPQYSHMKTPFGFPMDRTKWTFTFTDTARQQQLSPTANTWYNPGGDSITIPIGLWRVSWAAFIYGVDANSFTILVYATLSTANNSESDQEFTATSYSVGATATTIAAGNENGRIKDLLLASKTTYYLNIRTTESGYSSIDFLGMLIKTRIEAVCAYL